jgi:hypothetical protein
VELFSRRYTAAQVAAKVGVTARTVRKWCAQLEGTRVVGRVPRPVTRGPRGRWEVDGRVARAMGELVRLQRELGPGSLKVLACLQALPPEGFAQRVLVWLDRLHRLHLHGVARHLDRALRFQARIRGWGRLPPRRLVYWAWRATKGARAPVHVRLAVVYAVLEDPRLVQQLRASGVLPTPEDLRRRSCSWLVADSRERRQGLRRELPPELAVPQRWRRTPRSW